MWWQAVLASYLWSSIPRTYGYNIPPPASWLAISEPQGSYMRQTYMHNNYQLTSWLAILAPDVM